MSGQVHLPADQLVRLVADMFVATGIPRDGAGKVAEDLVAADVEGVASHGVMLVPMYIDRIQAGSVSTATEGRIVSDQDAAIVVDAGNALGQLTARQAVVIASERARELGVAVVAVRNAFHFGTAGRYARMFAEHGCVGIVTSNTRPLMPPPGGAQPVTGNNPLAIAVPSDGEFAPEVDMALSAAAMGKIRNAAAAGNPIPKGWATDRNGADTTDPNAAIDGMLLPAAGPKGFGLAFVLDLLCGGLSGGGIGSDIRPLYGSPTEPYNCANLFIALHVGWFADEAEFKTRVHAATQATSGVARAPGVERVFAPGELAYRAREEAGGGCKVTQTAFNALMETGRKLGIDTGTFIKEQV